jgi:hypothetical protein
LRASQGKLLNPCIQYPNPHKPSICWLPTWPESLLSSYPRFILPFLWETWSGVINTEPKGWVLDFAGLQIVLGFFLWKEHGTAFKWDSLVEEDICIFGLSGDNFVTGLRLAIDKGIMVLEYQEVKKLLGLSVQFRLTQFVSWKQEVRH